MADPSKPVVATSAQRSGRQKAFGWGCWSDALADHRIFISHWPRIFGAYAGPNSLEPALIEAVMLTINSVNDCPFCTGLHCELARIGGVEQPLKLNQASTEAECLSLSPPAHAAAVRYAHIFARNDGRGAEDAAAYAALADAMGEGRARSVRALCWFLYWGSFSGNTIDAALGSKVPEPGYNNFFLYVFLAYYAFLFFVLINAVSLLLKALPRVPDLVMTVLGLVLAAVAGAVFAPLGALGALLDA